MSLMYSKPFPPSVDEILKDQIYLGNLSAAESDETRQKRGITHILSVCPELRSTGANHLVIPVDDSDYDDLLIHLPKACHFIEDALAHGGRVLIHCVMGISRSTTVLAAYLMKTRSLSVAAAISFMKQYRPQVQPNYGFVKQLEAFLECGCAPSATHPAYVSWKRRQKKDVTNFLKYLMDCAVIVPDALLLCSEFPSDPLQAELLLIDLGVTHFLSLAPTEVTSAPPGAHHRHIDVPPDVPDKLLVALADACNFIRDAVAGGGKVLVHSLLEARACTVVGAYLMASRNILPEAAAAVIQDALPLFDPTSNFTRALNLFAACKCKPTLDHPAIAAHRVPTARSNGYLPHAASRGPSLQSAAACNTELLTRTAAAVMSETGIDMSAFSDTLVAIQQKASMAHPTAAVV
ncbi:Phosphatases II [Mycena venus]|uniref:protein-tyrosine-phosphatase n=1 Tax=Mycena venus TaxID=2733690 RepID=A0A8H6Y726_9AGAR|nr:Phosphatases II [Mycena venus]